MWLIRAIDPDGNRRFIVTNGATAKIIARVLDMHGLPLQMFPVTVHYDPINHRHFVIDPVTNKPLFMEPADVRLQGYAEARNAEAWRKVEDAHGTALRTTKNWRLGSADCCCRHESSGLQLPCKTMKL